LDSRTWWVIQIDHKNHKSIQINSKLPSGKTVTYSRKAALAQVREDVRD